MNLFDKMKIEQVLELVKNLLIEDEIFINMFEKIFCKKNSVNKENVVKRVISLMTSSPQYEFAVSYFVFKYITNNLKECAKEFKDEEGFENMINKIEKEFENVDY